MNLVVFGIGVLLCLVLGILLSYFTQLDWLPASLLVFAALHLHAALLMYVDSHGGDGERGEPALNAGLGAVWFWGQTLLITFAAAGLGAYLQAYH